MRHHYYYGLLELDLFPEDKTAKVAYMGNMGNGMKQVQECLLKLGEKLKADPATEAHGKLILDHVHGADPVENEGSPDYAYYALYGW